MSHKKHYHSFHHVLKQVRRDLQLSMKWVSLKWSSSFVPNVVLCIGMVFIWRWIWNLIDSHFFVNDQILSNILSIGIGLFLLYLPDQSFEHLSGYEIDEQDVSSSDDPLEDDKDSKDEKENKQDDREEEKKDHQEDKENDKVKK